MSISLLVATALISLALALSGRTHDAPAAPPDLCANYTAYHFTNIADCRIAEINAVAAKCPHPATPLLAQQCKDAEHYVGRPGTG